MSLQNVEMHRRIIDAFSRRDIEALLEVSDPEIEFRSIFAGIESGGAFRGHEGVRNWWKNLLSVFPDFTLEVDDVRDLGDVTAARVRLLGHGRGSSVPVEQASWSVANWRDEKAIWWGTFESEYEALSAAGQLE